MRESGFRTLLKVRCSRRREGGKEGARRFIDQVEGLGKKREGNKEELGMDKLREIKDVVECSRRKFRGERETMRRRRG